MQKQIQSWEGVCGGREARTHCEANANGGGEGPWDELALVVLNQQRGLAHAAVSHQDRLQRESQKEVASCVQAPVLPEARPLCGLTVWVTVHVHVA